MNTVRRSFQALIGERALTALPPLQPYADDPGDGSLRRRLALFPGRTLTHGALLQEQRSRIGDAMRLAQSVAPGVIDGLEVAIEPLRSAAGRAGAALAIGTGHAIAPDGQDLHLTYPLRVDADRIVVWTGDPRAPTLGQRRADAALRTGLTHAMVLVARPLTMVIDRLGGGNDPCVNATEPELNPALAWEDGFQLAWVPWPADRPLPPWQGTDGQLDARLRNRVAYAIFNAERERLSAAGLRSMRRFVAGADVEPLAASRLWPWDALGVPLALVGFDGAFVPAFADRAAVVRQGGGRRNRTAMVPMAGDDVLWSARMAQWIEHLAELPADAITPERLAAAFDWLPPAGVVPLGLADFALARQRLFPPGFDVQAQPVPVEMIDALIAESAPLLPYNLSLRDQVQLLVPVPAADYEPGLLDLRPALHPIFDLEIARLRGERARLLQRRDGLRRRWDLLLRCITGRWPAYPADDADGLPDEQGAADAMGLLRVHRTEVAARGTQVHGVELAHVALDVAPGDDLVVFVRVDAPVAGLALRVFAGPRAAAATPLLVWGQGPADATGASSGTSAGDLPATVGAWLRLTVPVARAGLAGTRVDGVEFHAVGGAAAGRVVWACFGKTGGGFETVWLGDALPPGAQAFGTWIWDDQGAPFTAAEDTAAGLPLEPAGAAVGEQPAPPRRVVSEVTRLIGSWTAFKDGVLLPEIGEMSDAERAKRLAAGQEARRAVDEGLDAILVRLDGRVRSARDHVDLGFLRARTDIFRVRQGVLGTDNARRFLTSTTAAELVQRDENPVVSERAFADYFKRLGDNIEPPQYSKAPVQAPAQAQAPAKAAARTAAARKRAAKASTSVPATEATPVPGPEPGFAAARTAAINVATSAPSAPLARGVLLGGTPVVTAGTVKTGTTTIRDTGTTRIVDTVVTTPTRDTSVFTLDLGQDNLLLRKDTGIVNTIVDERKSTAFDLGGKAAIVPGGLIGAEAKAPQLASASTPLVDAVVGASLLGATQNDITLADRFGGATAILTSNAAAKGKTDFVNAGTAGLKALGLVIDDLPVFGFSKTVGGAVKTDLQVSDLAGSQDLDAAEPAGTDLHEAVYFKRTIDSIDNLVRFLRGVELRAEDYRRLQSDVSAARERMQAAANVLFNQIAQIATQLGEVRHDLSVALSLRAEEAARLAALVERRRTVLRERVPYLVFRRPRLTQALANVPLLAMQPAVVDDPVPRCRSEQHSLPAELQAMVDTLRDVPARWLRPLVRDFGRFDQLDDLTRLLGHARERLAAPLPFQLGVTGDATSTAGALLGERLAQHARQLTQVHAESRALLPQINATNWKQALVQVQQVVSIRDIVAVAPSSHPVTLQAAGLLDDVAGVAACLHDALCQTPAELRLRWAQLFSQLDAPVSLRQLTTLPGFGRASSTGRTEGNDAIAWRRMQTMVDWLFAQVVDEPVPVRAIDDLVRVCVLLSAHAPVKRIVSARVRRPVPAIRNSMLDLSLDVKRARVGMQVLVHSPLTKQVVARAVIEDLHAEGASARITQVMTAETFDIDTTMRVQLQTGPALSSPSAAKAEQAMATGAATPPPTRAAPAAQAESAVARKVQQLATKSAGRLR